MGDLIVYREDTVADKLNPWERTRLEDYESKVGGLIQRDIPQMLEQGSLDNRVSVVHIDSLFAAFIEIPHELRKYSMSKAEIEEAVLRETFTGMPIEETAERCEAELRKAHADHSDWPFTPNDFCRNYGVLYNGIQWVYKIASHKASESDEEAKHLLSAGILFDACALVLGAVELLPSKQDR